MPSYSHLSSDERVEIAVLSAAGQSIGAIARSLGRAKSTICRELKRNRLSKGHYSPCHADGAYLLRRQRFACYSLNRDFFMSVSLSTDPPKK